MKGNVLKDKNREYYLKNRERLLEKSKKYEKENYNSEKRNQKYIKNRQKVIEQVREYRERDIDNSKKINNNHWQKNKELINHKRREKYATDLNYRLKYKAKEKVRRACEMGILIKPDICQSCSFKDRLEGHHKDYSKPLEVIWLCRKCHKQNHRKY